MEIELLDELLIILFLSIISYFICSRLKIPGIIGFLTVGAIGGPNGLGLINAVHEVEVFAEIGIVLLLFTIGIEFSIKKFLKLKKSVLLGGALQVFLTVIAVFFIANISDKYCFESAVFMGFLITLSSTAIVLKIIQERGEIDSPYGRTALSILIFQDIIIVPMMLFTPILGGVSKNVWTAILLLLGKGILILFLVFIGAKWVVPAILYRIAKTRSKELFLLTIMLLCFGVAWITFEAGLSLALGAFLAGLIISESDYNHEAMAEILPFRDIFTTFFFISIGMFLNCSYLYSNFWIVLRFAFLTIILKSLIAFIASICLGLALHTSILTGLALAQVGEFSFVLYKVGMKYELLSDYQLFLSYAVFTMAMTPFLISIAKPLSKHIMKLPIPLKLKTGFVSVSSTKELEKEELENHVIIVGFGLNGKNLAKACEIKSIPYVVIDTNPVTVKTERLRGVPVYYGDANSEIVLDHLGIKRAKIIVIGINDSVASLKITELARKLNSQIHIIIKSQFVTEMQSLYKAGANEVISGEHEASIEVFRRVLKGLSISPEETEKMINLLRSDNYKGFRSPFKTVFMKK